MDDMIKKYETGQTIVQEGEILQHAYYVEKGMVRVIQSGEKGTHCINLLKEGDIIGAESLASDYSMSFSLVANEETYVRKISRVDFVKMMSTMPPWFQNWINSRALVSSFSKKKIFSSVELLYLTVSRIYSFLRVSQTTDGLPSAKGRLLPIIQELRNAKTIGFPAINKILHSLSDVGLIDLMEGDPIAPRLLIPDQELFLSFIDFVRKGADIAPGLFENISELQPVILTPEAEQLVDAILTDEKIVSKVFEPERAMVHVSLEALQQVLENTGSGIKLHPNHGALIELETYGALTRIKDAQHHSAFLNLRKMLRLNIWRNPKLNFSDITDYICSSISTYSVE